MKLYVPQTQATNLNPLVGLLADNYCIPGFTRKLCHLSSHEYPPLTVYNHADKQDQ